MTDRLTDVEVKIAFLENTIAELDDVVRSLADKLGRVERELLEVQKHVAGRPERGSTDLADEVPPHY